MRLWKKSLRRKLKMSPSLNVKMQPLKITWELNSPMAVSGAETAMHLDDILAWAVMRDGELHNTPVDLPVVDLPLEKSGTYGVFKASCLDFTTVGSSFFFPLIKRFEFEDFCEDNGKVYKARKCNTEHGNKGRFKAFKINTVLQWKPTAEAYCVGDLERIKSLLSLVRGLGRLRRDGMGLIGSFEVVPCPSATTLWKKRNLPLISGEKPLKGYARIMGKCAPPYWKREEFEIIQTPLQN